MERSKGPTHLLVPRVAGDTKAGDVGDPAGGTVHGAGGSFRDVPKAPVIDLQRPQRFVNRANVFPRGVRQGRAVMRGSDGCQAEDAPLPLRVGEQVSGVESPHAVSDHMHGLAGTGQVDLPREFASAVLDPGDRRDFRYIHTISRRSKRVGNPSKVGGQGQSAHFNGTKTKEPMRQDDGMLELDAQHGALSSDDRVAL